MPGLFSITALAIAAERANAVGAVRLTCLPEGLEVELLRAAGFTEGFAPSSVAESVAFTVPYTAVRGLVRRGRTLCLALDPEVVSPHNRFALVRFTDDPAEALAGTYRARIVAKWLGLALPLPLGALAALLAPASLAGGALGAASLAVLVALAAWLVLREVVRFLTWGGPGSDAYRDAFEIELSRRLGLLPAMQAKTLPWEPPLAPAPRAPEILAPGARPPLHAAVPEITQEDARAAAALRAAAAAETGGRRARVVIAAVAVTLGVVGVMAFLKQFAAPRDVAPPSAQQASGIARAAQALARVDPRRRSGPPRPRCLCERADSPLWKDGVPALSVLLSASPDDGSGVVAPTIREGKKPRYNFDLAVVNNAGAPVHDVRVVLTFARRDPEGNRVGVTDRGLFWEGAMRPGRAVKWHVRAPGTELKIEPSVAGTLEEAGSPPAPADAFFALLNARYRVVRLHGAMMLAYLRDPRAEDAVRALGAASPGEALMLARIRRAVAPVIACDVAAKEGALEMCVWNGTTRAVEGLSAREVPSAPGATARVFPIDGAIQVHEGERIAVPLEGGEPPQELVIEAAGPAAASPSAPGSARD